MSKGASEGAGAATQLVELKQNLADLWSRREYEAAFALIHKELRPRISAHLQRQFHLSELDAQDCISDVMPGLVKSVASVQIPYQYMWTACNNRAVDLIRRAVRNGNFLDQHRRFLSPAIFVDPERDRVNRAFGTERGARANVAGQDIGTRSLLSAIPDIAAIEDAAIRFIEGIAEGVEAEASWAEDLLNAATARLSPSLRQVVAHLRANGPGADINDAAKDLGMKVSTFKAYKSKAYKELRPLIIEEMEKRDISVRRYLMPDLGFKQATIPTNEEETETNYDDTITSGDAE